MSASASASASASVSGHGDDDDAADETGVEQRETMDAGRSFQCSLIVPDWCEVAEDEDAARGSEGGVVYILVILGGVRGICGVSLVE